jgi:hypothetical protein
VFGRLLHEEDVEFDSICQKLNEHLIQLFAKCMLLMDSKQVWLNEALFQLLQSKTFTDIVKSSTVSDFWCYPALWIIVQLLWKTLFRC